MLKINKELKYYSHRNSENNVSSIDNKKGKIISTIRM